MTTRVNSIFIELEVTDEFEPNRIIRIPVSLEDEMVEAIHQRWQAYADELMKKAGMSSELGFW